MVHKSRISIRAEEILTSSYEPTQSVEISGTSFVSIYAKYTRGAVGGKAGLRVQGSFDGTTWYDMLVVDPSTLSAGAVDSAVMTLNLPSPGDASPTNYVVGQDVSGLKHFRLSVAEVGVIGTPGNIAIDIVMSDG